MIVCRIYTQTRVFNIAFGIVAPVVGSLVLWNVIPSLDLSHKIYYTLSLLILILSGLYFLFIRCVWGLRCDEGRRLLTFYKTFRKKTYPLSKIKELSVFKNFRGYDFYFTTPDQIFTFTEMDGMPELIAFMKKKNPRLNIISPEDHKYF